MTYAYEASSALGQT